MLTLKVTSDVAELTTSKYIESTSSTTNPGVQGTAPEPDVEV